MAVIEFEYEELKKYLEISKEKMIDTFNQIGAPAEESEGKIVLELTPNRPDFFSKEGLVRAARSYLGIETGLKRYSAKDSEYKVIVDPSVKKVRPYTCCAVVKGLELSDERIKGIVNLQEKLHATVGRKRKKLTMGFYELQKIKFPIRYEMRKPKEIIFTPLGFETLMDGNRILEEHPTGKEYGQIVGEWKQWPVYVDANEEILAVVPFINSEKVGKVNERTNEVFIDISGTSLHEMTATLNILITTLVDMGGQAYKVEIVEENKKETYPKLETKKMKLKSSQVNKILGIRLENEEIKKLLEKMGYGLENNEFAIPCYRIDVINQVDLIEDIAIAYGYNNFEPTLPDFFSKGNGNYRNEQFHKTLRGMGFSEVRTFVLSDVQRMKTYADGESKRVLNPCSEDFSAVRNNLLADIVETFKINKTGGLPQKFYEVGVVYESGQTKNKVVFGVMDKEFSFSDFRGYLQKFLYEQEVDFELKKSSHKVFSEECGYIEAKECNGVIGKVKKEVLVDAGIEFCVYICEICFE